MPDATVVIVTHNRKEDLQKAVESALAQVGDVEVLVMDDASTDGTDQLMQTQFPQVRYHRVEDNVGYIVHRNNASDLAQGRVLFSIDDDATFSTPHVVEQTLAEFDDPRVGAVAIPYVDVLKDDRIRQAAPQETGDWLSVAFRGTAYAVRKETFDQIGRFRASFRHQGEEHDFCLRMLGVGKGVKFGRSDVIHHFESPKRVRSYIFEQACRNWIVFVLMNVPLLDLPLHAAGKTATGLYAGVRKRLPWNALRGVCRGWWWSLKNLSERRPVSRDAFKLYRRLWQGEQLQLDEISDQLKN